MKNLTRNPNYPVDDDKKFLTSVIPEVEKNLYVDTGIETLARKKKKEKQKEITVFLVDDSLMYLTAMEHYLSQEIPGLNIRLFQTGETSLMQMYERPDIVVLDYHLDSEVPSAENGIVILKKMKHLNPATKVIILSCDHEFKVARNCMKHGAFDYVPKGERAFSRIKYLVMNLSGNNDFWID